MAFEDGPAPHPTLHPVLHPAPHPALPPHCTPAACRAAPHPAPHPAPYPALHRIPVSPRVLLCLQVPWPASWLKAPSNTAKGVSSWRAKEADWIFCPDPLDPGHSGDGWIARKNPNPAVKGKRKHGEVWVPWAMADNGRRGKMMDQSTPQGAWATAHEPPSVHASRLQREKAAAKKAAATPAAAAPKQLVFEYPKDAHGIDQIPTVTGVQSSFARSQAHYDQSRVRPGVPTLLESTSGRASNAQRADEPRITGLNARRIEHYETHLQQMRLVCCLRCDARQLVLGASSDVFGPKGCSVCEKCDRRHTVHNDMNPAPAGRLEQALREATADLERPKWLLPTGARYPPCFYMASVLEELLVTRFRTVMSVRHMPLKHRKYRGHTISFYQGVGEFADMYSDLLPVPLSLDKIAVWIVRAQLHKGTKHQDYRVRRDLVAELLRWLPILFPRLYHDVKLESGRGIYSGCGIDEGSLNNLPVDDSVFDQLPGSEYSAADGNTGSPMPASSVASTAASANGPMMSEYVSGSELDMDRSGFIGKPPTARNNVIAQRAAEHAVGRNKKGQPVFGFPKARTEGECEWDQCERFVFSALDLASPAFPLPSYTYASACALQTMSWARSRSCTLQSKLISTHHAARRSHQRSTSAGCFGFGIRMQSATRSLATLDTNTLRTA